MQFTSLDSLPDVPTTHGTGTKKVIIAPNTLRNIHQFGRTVFQLGEAVSPHSHIDYVEIMWIESGEAHMTIDKKSFAIHPGDVITAEAGETHAITVTKAPLILYFFAVYT